MEAFVSAAKQLPQEATCDVVEGYIKISMECAEIFQLLSGEKRPESEVGASHLCDAAAGVCGPELGSVTAACFRK